MHVYTTPPAADLPSGFIDLLQSCTLSEKRAMLLALNTDINSCILEHNKQFTALSQNDLVDYVDFIPDFLDPMEDDVLIQGVLAELESMNLISPQAKKVKTFWLNSINKSYIYGGEEHIANNLDDFKCIKQLMNKINTLPNCTGAMDSCNVTCFSTAKKSLRLHSDNEPIIDQDSSICTVSLGATRNIDFVSKSNKEDEFSYNATRGSLYIMKPGCQQVLKHRVPQGDHIVNGNNVRYSLSFRKMSNTSPYLPRPVPAFSPVKDKIKVFEDNITSNISSTSPCMSPTMLEKSSKNVILNHSFLEKATLIAGDSFTARLDPARLGKGRKNVINISNGGFTINQVEKSIDQFYLNNNQQIDQVFVSVGTNDIRNCKNNGVMHLRKPLTDLVNKIKLLFPTAKLFLQSLLPLPITQFNHHYVIRNVSEYNLLIEQVCRKEQAYILDVFWSFVDPRSGHRDLSYFPDDIRDCHPNFRGVGVLARYYIERIHNKHFDPYRC